MSAPFVHRRIADAAGAAWDRAHRLLLAARRGGASRADLDALADYAAEQRDTWLRVVERARREEEQRRVEATLAALDFDPASPDDGEFGFSSFEYGPDDRA